MSRSNLLILRLSVVILLAIALPVYPGSIFENSSGSSSSSSSSSSYSESNNSSWLGGPYKTEVNIVDSRVKFRPYVFKPDDFEGWMKLYRRSLAFAQFETWISTGTLSRQGRVLTSGAAIGQLRFEVGQTILPFDLIPFFENEFPSQFIFQALIKQGVLSKDGQIAGASKVNQATFNETTFAYLADDINKMKLSLASQALENALKNSLYDLLLSRMQVLSVTRQEDTHYESRRGNFFEAIADSFAGNLMGRVFYPQRIETDIHEIAWVSHLYVPSYYDFYRFGLNDYVYANGQKALLLNGRRDLTKINGTSLTDSQRTPQVTAISVAVERKILPPYFRFDGETAWGLLGRYDRFSTQGESIHFGSLGVKAGSISNSSSFSSGAGITLRQAQQNLYLGYHLGFGFEWYIINPISFETSVMMMAQPDLFRTGFSWSNTLANAGLNFHVGQYQAGVGYGYVGGASATIGSGPYFKVSAEF